MSLEENQRRLIQHKIKDGDEIKFVGTQAFYINRAGEKMKLFHEPKENGSTEILEKVLKAGIKMPEVVKAYGENGHLIIQAPEANDVLPQVLNHLNAAGVKIHSLEIQEPDLEAVFLHLTGRALRD